jgi:predicted TIM-barrel fold metal-dependent hydrolase
MQSLGEDRFSHTYLLKHCAVHTLEMISAVTSFVMGGICDCHPDLKVGFMEAGGGWLAGYLDRMDRHFDDVGLNKTDLKTRPSDIFGRQCFISFEPIERTLPLLADLLGRSSIVWGSDYPHSDGYTNAPAMFRNLGLSEDLYKDIMASGAKRMYGLK